jgi:hypothetical protein
MNALFDWVHRYGTRALAVAAGTITTLCGTGIVPAAHMKYYMAALALLTYWRGQSTSNAYNAATAAPLEKKP